MFEQCKKSCDEFEKTINAKTTDHKPRPYFERQESSKCQLYMAESSIPNSGLGMYTAVPISKGDFIHNPDIVVNYFDFNAYTSILEETGLDNDTNTSTNSAEWEAAVGDKKNKNKSCNMWAQEGECEDNPKYMLDSCARSCAALEAGLLEKGGEKKKRVWLPNDYYWDPSNTESAYEADEVCSLVPGLGALANSHTGLVNSHMERGQKDAVGLHRATDQGVGAFSNIYNLPYSALNDIPAGMELFVQYGDGWFEEREWKFGPLPLSYHFEEADEIIQNFWQHANEEDSFAEDLYNLTKDLVVDPKTKMALPETLESARVALEKGTAMLTVPNVIRSPEWLEENGLCLDNIRAEPSLLRQTGRGAFATRTLQKGEVIAPLSLLHMDSNRLRMFDDFGEDYQEINKQLIVNYCYGHKDSTLLLFPYSPIVNFVNNNKDKTQVNAKVRWSTSGHHAKDWESLTVAEVLEMKQAGLMLEFVASRDIEMGEEIYIDYGSVWDDAWDNHLSTWEAPDESEYVSLYQMNLEDSIRTLDEQKTNPYPKNIMTICFTTIGTDDITDQTDVEYEWEDFQAVPRSLKNSRECEVLERYKSKVEEKSSTGDVDLYTVRFVLEEKTECIMSGMPRTSMEFVDRSYISDQHLKNGFRHPIQIPDEIFPQNWKNLI